MKYFKKIAVKKMQRDDDSQQKVSLTRKSSKKSQNHSQTQVKNIKWSQAQGTGLKKSSNNLKKNHQNSKVQQWTPFSNKNHLQQSNLPQQYQKSKRLRISKSFDQLDRIKDSYTFRKDEKVGYNQKNFDSCNNPFYRNNTHEANFYSAQQDNSYNLYNVQDSSYNKLGKCKNDYEDDSKTQVKMFKKNTKNGPLHHQIDNPCQDELQYYKNKVNFLENVICKRVSAEQNNNFINTLQKNNNNEQYSFNNIAQATKIFDQYHYKLRQKSLQLQELKGRIKYYQSSTQQLRNRVLNQQKRHQDYISTIKNHAKQLEQQLFQHKKQNKILQQVIKQCQYKIQSQIQQKVKYIEQIQTLLKQKQTSNIQSKSKSNDLKKQLAIMSQQQSYIRDLQNMIKQSKIQQTMMMDKLNKLQNQSLGVKQELHHELKERQTLQELLQLKLEQIQTYKMEIHKLKREITQSNQDLQKIKSQLAEYRKNQQEIQIKKQKLMRRKVDKLKEVKSLLVGQL